MALKSETTLFLQFAKGEQDVRAKIQEPRYKKQEYYKRIKIRLNVKNRNENQIF